MAISTALRGFSDLGRTVTPVFLLMDHFLYQFSALSEKMKKIYRLKIFIFCKMHDRILFLLDLRSSVRRFQMPFEGSSFVKTLVKFGIIYVACVASGIRERASERAAEGIHERRSHE